MEWSHLPHSRTRKVLHATRGGKPDRARRSRAGWGRGAASRRDGLRNVAAKRELACAGSGAPGQRPRASELPYTSQAATRETSARLEAEVWSGVSAVVCQAG